MGKAAVNRGLPLCYASIPARTRNEIRPEKASVGWLIARSRPASIAVGVFEMLVIGLDGAAPQWVFDRWLDVLPTLRSLTKRGTFGVLRSCDPPSRCRRVLRSPRHAVRARSAFMGSATGAAVRSARGQSATCATSLRRFCSCSARRSRPTWKGCEHARLAQLDLLSGSAGMVMTP